MTAEGSQPAVCATCGAVAPAVTGAAPLTWSVAVEDGRRVWTCDRCARDHLRSIEAKLDRSWW
jgi:Zn-finger protein